MASALIHLAIAKKVQEQIKVEDKKDYYLGAIAPDISKQIGLGHDESHFQLNTIDNLPNINLFMKRYPLFQYNSFDLGYFTHLYTDKKWKKEFMSEIINNNSIKLLDGTIIKTTKEEMKNMIYSDYTNLNTKLIDDYNLDLSLFYEDFQKPKTKIKEIPIEELDILINKMGILIENTKEEKAYTFEIEPVEKFINETSKEILKLLK